ncbi:MAG: HAD family hydrolase [Oscillospiraceae bacterium]
MKKYYIFDLDGTLADSMGYWYGNFPLEGVPAEQRMDVIREVMYRHYSEEIQPKPGAVELLERLKAAGAVMCIASATEKQVSAPFLEKFGLNRFFEFYLDCTEAGARKDKPDIYLQAAQRLGADIADCVVAEDAAYCAETAQNAGFFVVGIYDENTAPRGNVADFCDCFITRLEDFPEL